MVSSVEIFSGDSKNITLPELFDSYSIIGNSTPVDLNITQEELIATITINKYQQSDNFTIVFYNKSKETIKEVPIYRGGGGGTTKYIDKEVIVEVPKFYDRNVTNEIEIINDKIVYEESDPIWFYVSLFVILLCIIIGVLYLRSKSNETKNEYY